MKKLSNVLALFSLCIAMVMGSIDVYGQGVNTPRPKGTTSSNFGYYEYLPLDYNTNTNKYPILIFIHGIGEKGDGTLSSLKEMLYHGPMRETARGRDFPFIIVSPQSPVNWNVDEINKFVEFVKTKYRTNTSKMYMTGLSLGAMATYTYASKYNQQLAAIVPIAGKANLNTICNMSHIPLWAFHGDADGTISVQYDKDAIRKYNSCTPTPSPLGKLTIYPGVGHNSWTRTYDGSAGHDIYKWMLQYTKGSTRTTTNVAPTASAGADKTITLPTNSLTLYGSASDSDGTIASTTWTKVSGPTATLSGATTTTLKLTNLLQGSYTFRLTAKDNAGAIKYDDVLVTVNSSSTSNLAPTVSAGANKTITLPTSSLTLYGSASDSDGSIASTTWTKVSGPTATLSGATTTTLKLTNLLQGSYTFRLTAKDNAGATKYDDVLVTVNAATTTSNGVSYKYYTTTSSAPFKLLPNFSNLTPAKTGTVSNFSLGPKTQSDYFAFMFDAQIQIDAAGTYTFYSYSDDGSKLFINGTLVVSNDGCHAAQERSGSIYLAAGKHNIKVTYFEYINGETLSVKYAGPSISKQLIPNSKLFPASSTSTTTSPTTGLVAPSSLTAALNSTKTGAYLTWKDNSTNESGFEIQLSAGTNTSFKSVASCGYNKTSYMLGNLTAGQTYYIRIRAKNSQGYSAWSNVVMTSGTTTTALRTASAESAEAEAEEAEPVFTAVSVYPNPVANVVNINFGSEFQSQVRVQLLDTSGRVLHTQNADAQQAPSLQLDLIPMQLKTGMYIISIDNGQHRETVKILKN